MPQGHAPRAERQEEHPAAHHYQHAADHLRRGAAYLDKAQKRVGRNEHASAAELAKAAAGHIGQAQSHLGEAQRVHAERSSEARAHAEGSHWNESDESETEG